MAVLPQGRRGAPTILLLAGETSGDLHGARLARALKRRIPGVRLVGLGGPDMAAEGVELLAGLEDLAVMGFSEVLRHLPFFVRLGGEVKELIGSGRVDLAAGPERAQHDRGTGNGDDTPEKNRHRDVESERCENRDGRPPGEHHLERAAGQDEAPQAPHPFERQLHPDSEQEERHSDLGQNLDLVDVGHDPEHIGPHNDPGRDKTGDGGHVEAPQHHDHHDRNCKNDNQILQQLAVHGAIVAAHPRRAKQNRENTLLTLRFCCHTASGSRRTRPHHLPTTAPPGFRK